jgi:hypothetical protein
MFRKEKDSPRVMKKLPNKDPKRKLCGTPTDLSTTENSVKTHDCETVT